MPTWRACCRTATPAAPNSISSPHAYPTPHHTTPWIWAGDFNFGDQDTEAEDIAHRVDVWTWLRPADPGHTYDLAANPLAKANAFADEPSRRLDRILSSARLRPTAVGLAGQAFGANGPVSDHFGVWADLVPSP